ncbi:MAG: aspartate dehydrogenase domain-containing protein [Pseudomonadota bacterium]
MSPRRVGLIGFGSVGQYLATELRDAADHDLAFVYNRSDRAFDHPALQQVRKASGAFDQVWPALDGEGVDVVVEVAHPSLVTQFGERILESADLYVASITALADASVAGALRNAAVSHALYLPAGAAWGVNDVARMDRIGSVQQLNVAMRFHADSLRLNGEPAERLAAYRADADDDAPCLLFDGSVEALAPLAPNNVNTMTCLALAASKLGPANTGARLFAHKLDHAHIVEVDVLSAGGFHVHTRRYNPALPGAVTGSATYGAFLASLLATGGHKSGMHFC